MNAVTEMLTALWQGEATVCLCHVCAWFIASAGLQDKFKIPYIQDPFSLTPAYSPTGLLNAVQTEPLSFNKVLVASKKTKQNEICIVMWARCTFVIIKECIRESIKEYTYMDKCIVSPKCSKPDSEIKQQPLNTVALCTWRDSSFLRDTLPLPRLTMWFLSAKCPGRGWLWVQWQEAVMNELKDTFQWKILDPIFTLLTTSDLSSGPWT